MNFLAHIFLSGNNDNLRLGNFIGDYVKGSEYNKFENEVRKGILLHRNIDSFTDSHPIVRNHKTLFYSKYHKYAGIVTDIIYDHYLAHEWHIYSDVCYDDYVDNVHAWLLKNVDGMPLELKKFVPNFIRSRWLNSYQTLEGIERVLMGMSKGTSLPAEYEFAMLVLRKNYGDLKHDFFNYFPQLVNHVDKVLQQLHFDDMKK